MAATRSDLRFQPGCRLSRREAVMWPCVGVANRCEHRLDVSVTLKTLNQKGVRSKALTPQLCNCRAGVTPNRSGASASRHVPRCR